MARSRPTLCLDCGDMTYIGPRCGECGSAREAHRRIYKGKTSERYPAEYQRNRRKLLDHARAEGAPCSLQIEGVCTGRPTTADHITPINRGGDHSLENLQPACGPCNSSKRDTLRRIL